MSNPAFIVALVFGALMLLSVCWVYITKQMFSLGGSVLTVGGVILMGMSVWRTIDVSVDAKGFKARLEQVEDQISQVQKKTTVVEKRLDVRVAQDQLAKLGIYDGVADGFVGPSTIAAIRQFQAGKGLLETGELDATTKLALGMQPAQL